MLYHFFFIYLYNQLKYGVVLHDYTESISRIYLGVRKSLIGSCYLLLLISILLSIQLAALLLGY